MKDEKGLPHSAIETQVKFLQGKVLTVIDAAFADREQKKAVKDLINQQFREQLDWIYELCHGTSLGGLKTAGGSTS